LLLLDTSVSKQSNEARVVTAAAYLLFYRRRSDEPLGGPRFQSIIEDYEAKNGDEEVMADSGEGQRLGQGSSQLGSPSALIGAVATRPLQGPGSASGSLLNTGSSGLSRINGADGEPDYQASAGIGGDDGSKGTSGTSTSMPALEDVQIVSSIEDEGIDMIDAPKSMQHRQTHSGGMTSAMAPTWGWGAVDDTDKSSGQNHPDGLSASIEPGSDYVEPDEPQPPPAPTSEAQLGMDYLRGQIWEHKGQLQNDMPVLAVPADVGEDDGASDRVDEIHLKDEDDSSTAAKLGEY
jgi:ubiquitin carboxyl-terminal hydrolase 4/11